MHDVTEKSEKEKAKEYEKLVREFNLVKIFAWLSLVLAKEKAKEYEKLVREFNLVKIFAWLSLALAAIIFIFCAIPK